jgi:hypothetical protein
LQYSIPFRFLVHPWHRFSCLSNMFQIQAMYILFADSELLFNSTGY